MSEVCHTCPIAMSDPDAPLLCAAAARLANVEQAYGFAMKYSEHGLTAEERLDADRVDTYEDALAELGCSPRKIEQARKCAEFIMWKSCDFHSIANQS